ncbi:nuclear transport factor 2 family protein [Streptomyces sp. NPDC002734]|uniref:nuclear transport factor 2 family protein n=1 Tax=Streptomyces sp. NPDC002734 TaxID=3154426 RepID=UPI00331E88B3
MSQTLGTTRPRVPAGLYVEVQAFYAYQLPLLEDRKVEEFALTFTEDGVYAHAKDGWELTGREQLVTEMRKALPHYGTSIFRHWFDKLVIEERPDGTVAVAFRSLVSVTDEQGQVTFEPSATIHDELVRRDGELLTRRRTVRHDIPDPARYWSAKLD